MLCRLCSARLVPLLPLPAAPTHPRSVSFWTRNAPATAPPRNLRRVSPPHSQLPGTPASYSPRPLAPSSGRAHRSAVPRDQPSALAPLPERPEQQQQQQQQQPPRRANPLKNRLVHLLETRRPRRALRLFLAALHSSASLWGSRTSEGLIVLFLRYRQPALALEAITALHNKGYAISGAMCVKLLQLAYDNLVLRTDQMTLVVDWLLESIRSPAPPPFDLDDGLGIDGDIQVDGRLSEGLVTTLMETLWRAGRPELAVALFREYAAALPAPAIPAPTLYALYIRAQGLPDARRTFGRWRAAFLAASPDQAPPAEPYLALLQLYVTAIPPDVSVSLDPATSLLRTLKKDGVPVSPLVFSALLQLELARRRYTSFWSIFQRYLDSPLVLTSHAWRLALKAKTWEQTRVRQRARVHGSPVLQLTGTDVVQGPSMRGLFRLFLASAHDLTSGRPAVVLPITKPEIRDSSILNSFLKSFVALGDWRAAAVVLETFGVHRIEPEADTHSAVVLGVVSHWEKGHLDRRGIALAETVGVGRGDAMLVLRRILEARKMRVGLWTTSHGGAQGPAARLIENGWDVRATPSPTPDWMLTRELRDCGYLVSLLRRCDGLSEDEWGKALVNVRKELLPRPRDVVQHSHEHRLRAWKQRTLDRLTAKRQRDQTRSPSSRFRARLRRDMSAGAASEGHSLPI